MAILVPQGKNTIYSAHLSDISLEIHILVAKWQLVFLLFLSQIAGPRRRNEFMSVSISDVVAITGQPGLFRLLKSNDNAIIVESLESKPKRQLIKGNMMVSKLTDVSMYTEEDSEPLGTILLEIHNQFGEVLPVSKKSSNEELMQFLAKVLPGFDEDRVYPSNVKKLVSWYKILMREGVDLSSSEDGESPTATASGSDTESPSEE